ncbi:MAG: hypothetical protein AAF657_12930 [Acidobacteriota bacterium]
MPRQIGTVFARGHGRSRLRTGALRHAAARRIPWHLSCLVGMTWLGATVAVAAQPRPVAVEDAYLSRVSDWAKGSPEAAADLAQLHHRLASHLAGFEITVATYGNLPAPLPNRRRQASRQAKLGENSHGKVIVRDLPGVLCWQLLQKRVSERLAEVEPEAYLPLAFLHAELYTEQTGTHYRPWLASLAKARSFALIEAYLQAAEPDEATARRNTVSLLIGLADRLMRFSFLESGVEARDVYLGALRLQPENPAALYWAGYLQEMLGNYGKAVPHWQTLLQAKPEDAELQLRLAINRARLGDLDTATTDLEAIADGTAEARFRLIAFQELGRLFAENAPRRAAQYLRQGSKVFPENPRLRLQLSSLQADDWQRSTELTRQVELDWRGDTGESARLLYSAPRTDELHHELQRLEIEVERRKGALAKALAPMLALAKHERLRLAACPQVPIP